MEFKFKNLYGIIKQLFCQRSFLFNGWAQAENISNLVTNWKGHVFASNDHSQIENNYVNCKENMERSTGTWYSSRAGTRV